MAKLDSINYKGTLQEIVPEIAPLFKTTEAYSAGDHVIHDAQWYTFKEDKAAGAWDDTKVDGPFTVSEKISELKEDTTQLKSELTTHNKLAFGKNLYGGLVEHYYPVYIKAGEEVTWSLSEGNLYASIFYVEFYDKNKAKVSFYGSSSYDDRPSRTVVPSTDTDIYYLRVTRAGNGSTFPTAGIQIELGDTKTAYEEYHPNPKENSADIANILKQMTLLTTFTVAANATHSSALDKIPFRLSANEDYYVYVIADTTRTMQLYEYTDAPYGNTLQNNVIPNKPYKFTSENGADYISLFVANGTDNPTVTLYGMRATSLDADILSRVDELQQGVDELQQGVDELQQGVVATSTFTVAANATHSSTLHRIGIDVPANEYYYMVCKGLDGRIGQFFVADGDGTTTQYEAIEGSFTCKKSKYGVTSIGLFVGTGSTPVNVTFYAFKATTICADVYNDYDRRFLSKLFNANRKANPSRYGALTTPDIFTVAHFSDIHGNANAAQEAQRFKDKYGSYIDDVVCTGDVVLDKISDGMAFWDNNTDGSMLICIGNHDSLGANGWSNPVSQATLYNIFIAPYESNWNADIVANHSYWYKDYEAKKIRIVSVDATIFDTTEQSAQIAWLETALSGTITNGYSVVGLVHFPPMPAYYQKITSNFSALLHGTAGDMSQFAWGTYCTEILDTVNTFINNGGDFVCWLSGHTHYDLMSYDTRYPKQLFITVTCAFSSAEFDERSRDSEINANFVINTVSIDAARKYIKLIRYGAEWDDCLRHVGTCTVDYSTSPATVLYQN